MGARVLWGGLRGLDQWGGAVINISVLWEEIMKLVHLTSAALAVVMTAGGLRRRIFYSVRST